MDVNKGNKKENKNTEMKPKTKEKVPDSKDFVETKQVKQKLSIEEKLKLLDELAGFADCFSPEGVEETIRIANREYDQKDKKIE